MEGGDGGSYTQDQHRPPPIKQYTAHRLDKPALAHLPTPARAALDCLAQQSAHSQGLTRGPISCLSRLLASDNHVVYLLTVPSPSSPAHSSTSSSVSCLSISSSRSSSSSSRSSSACSPIGFLKLGRKHLFVINPEGQLVETSPLCLLDFYISTPYQRHGLGASFLRAVLRHEGLEGAHLLAYDRPSHRLLPFLAKHFELKEYGRQHNHFVLFDEYFSSASSSSSSSSSSRSSSSSSSRSSSSFSVSV